MHTITRNIAIMLCATLLLVPAARAADFCWTGEATEFFDDERSWDDCAGENVDNPPGVNDTAIIKANASKHCHVRETTTVDILEVENGSIRLEVGVEAGSDPTLTVNDHAQIDGTVRIIDGSTLELAGTTTSNVHGTIVFWTLVPNNPPAGTCDDDPTGTLLISDNSTVEGNGGWIYGRECTTYDAPTRGIIRTATGKRLTLDTPSGGDNIQVFGHLDIKALLTNEGGDVFTDEADDVLLLSVEDKSGNNGSWQCRDGEFRVKTGVKITGSNWWNMGPLAADGARMYFDSGSDVTCLSGDFDVSHGIMDVDTDLCTSGTATVSSVSNSEPQIIVRSGNAATFGGVCSTLCP